MITTITNALLMDRCGGICELCQSAPASNRHHRRPRGAGGSKDPITDSVVNLLMLCGSGTTGCHQYVESNRALAYENGWLVRQGHNPEAIPVRLLELVYLAPDGSYLLAE